MLLSRILGGLGRVMIATGVLLLLFVGFQLWGTGLRTNAAQDRLAEDFARKRDQVTTAGPATSAPSTSVASSDGAPPATTAPSPATDPFPPPKPGEPIGQIAIPKIGADFEMVEGVDLSYLSEGPGHFPGTPFPGQAGNAALAGHRTTWLAPFNRIDELAPGDTVTITTLQGTFTYQVIPQPGANPGEEVGYKIISPNQTEILEQPPAGGDNTLTLMACHPKYSAQQRIVVVAKLVGNPAATTAKSEESQRATQNPEQSALLGGAGGGLLSNNPEERAPALAWGLVAAAVWLAAWFVARRWPTWRQWQRWVVYLVALPFFLVPLFFCFEHINHLLPAGY